MAIMFQTALRQTAWEFPSPALRFKRFILYNQADRFCIELASRGDGPENRKNQENQVEVN